MKVLVFGEALWDVFPDGKKLGGAPVNFAAHLAQLGANASILTAVGDDILGHELVREIRGLNVDTKFVSVLTDKPTGVCNVILNNGEPAYDLIEDVAYDYIPSNKSIYEQNFDVLYFGTLAQRSYVSKSTLHEVLKCCHFNEVFCDLNLRGSYYTKSLIQSCLQNSTILKLNRYECEELVNLGIVNPFYSYQKLYETLCDAFSIHTVIITLDSEGALCFCRMENHMLSTKGLKAKRFKSAVGAGDVFSACFLYNYMRGVTTLECLNRANALGAYIVTFSEAIVQYSDEIKKMMF